MKKLLFTGLVITSFIALNAQAQPVALNATFNVSETLIRRDLAAYTKDGRPPYSFTIYGGPSEISYNTDLMAVLMHENGVFDFSGFNGESTYSFQYVVTDATGQTSQPATVTIIVGPVKG